MVMVRDFEFSLGELAGGLGDLGTFIPFTIGYIVFSGFDATGIMGGFGVTHILLALVYRLPLPLQPMKVIGSRARESQSDQGSTLISDFKKPWS